MFRILVVDDEEIITNSLTNMLQNTLGEAVDVYAVYSGLQAMDYLRRASFDIVVTDIQMPGMDGIELLKQVQRLYPACRVIFLSGHDDFTYAYQAVQYHAARYVLKSEADTVLLEALGECMAEIDREAHRDAALQRAHDQMLQCLPILKRDFLGNLLNGGLPEAGVLAEAFRRYGVMLEPGLPLIMLSARLDETDSAEQPAAVDILVRDCLALRCECCVAKPSYMLWLIQPEAGGDAGQAAIVVRGAAERMQRACVQTLSVSVSFVLDTTPVRWEDLHKKSDELYHAMLCMLDKQEKMAFVYLDYFDSPNTTPLDTQRVVLHDMLEGLKNALQAGAGDALEVATAHMVRFVAQQRDTETPEWLSFFNRLNAVLLGFVDSHNLYGCMADEGLFRVFLAKPMAGNALQRAERFSRLADMALTGWAKQQQTKTDALLSTVDAYIHEHLSKELSLVTLSEHVYLNPSYLSRRYKELSGGNLIDAITHARLERAMVLLHEDGAKVREIAEQVGYLSSTHFIRVFKRNMGITPQEWRDNQLGRNK